MKCGFQCLGTARLVVNADLRELVSVCALGGLWVWVTYNMHFGNAVCGNHLTRLVIRSPYKPSVVKKREKWAHRSVHNITHNNNNIVFFISQNNWPNC